MKTSRYLLGILAVVAASPVGTPAFAQYVVTAPIIENYNAVTQYPMMVKQLAQEYENWKKLVDQLTQQKLTFSSISGTRGLGEILIEDYTKISPSSTSNALNIMGGNDQTSAFAKQYSSQTTQLSSSFFANVPATIIADLQLEMDGHAAQKGANASVYQAAADRYSRMDNIRAQIQCTQDQKAILELQGRMQAESMIAQNELVKLTAMNAMLEQDQKLQDEKSRQQMYQMTATQY